MCELRFCLGNDLLFVCPHKIVEYQNESNLKEKKTFKVTKAS